MAKPIGLEVEGGDSFAAAGVIPKGTKVYMSSRFSVTTKQLVFDKNGKGKIWVEENDIR